MGSVRLQPRAPNLHFSRALVAGLVPRPPPRLSPSANSRGRAPPSSRATLNRARFRCIFRRRGGMKASFCETARFYSLCFFFFCFLPSWRYFVPCTRSCCCDLGSSPSFDISSISRPRGRYRFPSLDYFPGSVAFGRFDPPPLVYQPVRCSTASSQQHL